MLGIYTGAAFRVVSGDVVAAPNADVEVRYESTGSLVPVSALFEDVDGETQKAANPFQADANGNYHFYAIGVEEGYRVKSTKDGFTFTLRHQHVQSPPPALLIDAAITQGRLTGTTGVPVTIADVTAIETIRFTPYKGNQIALFTGTAWELRSFSEITGDVPDATNMYDVFVYDNGGVLALDIVAWANPTTRATALATQDGVYVKTGSTGRKYVGSFYCTTAGNGQTEDSRHKRHIWNYYNRVSKSLRRRETTESWTYTTQIWRQANANTANQVEVAVGVAEDTVSVDLFTAGNNTSTGWFAVAIALDSITDPETGQDDNVYAFPWTSGAGASQTAPLMSKYRGAPAIGRHYFAWLEISEASGSTSFNAIAAGSSNMGLLGHCWC